MAFGDAFASSFAAAAQLHLGKAQLQAEIDYHNKQLQQSQQQINNQTSQYQQTFNQGVKEHQDAMTVSRGQLNVSQEQLQAQQSANLSDKLYKEKIMQSTDVDMGLKTAANINGMAVGVLTSPKAQQPAMYQAMLQQARLQGTDITGWPKDMSDPSAMPYLKVAAQSTGNYMEWKKNTFDITKLGVDENDKLRGEYNDQSKDYVPIVNAFNTLKSSYANPPGTPDPNNPGASLPLDPKARVFNDQAMIMSYIKMINPGAVVRGPNGEETVTNAKSLPTWVQNLYQKEMTGNELLPSERDSLLQSAQQVYGAAQSQHKQVENTYWGLAMQNGLTDPAQVVTDYDSHEKHFIAKQGLSDANGKVIYQPGQEISQDDIQATEAKATKAGTSPVDLNNQWQQKSVQIVQ
jgi:hypothetical protein